MTITTKVDKGESAAGWGKKVQKLWEMQSGEIYVGNFCSLGEGYLKSLDKHTKRYRAVENSKCHMSPSLALFREW